MKSLKLRAMMALPIAAIIAAVSVWVVYDAGASVKTAANKLPCEGDVFFCGEGWVPRGTNPEGGQYFYCGETDSWIICTSTNQCLCYYSETCPCPPVSPEFSISAETRKELDALIEKQRKEKNGS